MHCSACPVLIESEIADLAHVTAVRASLKARSVEVTGEFGDASADDVARSLTGVLQRHGYTISEEKSRHAVAWQEFGLAVPVAAAFIAFYVILQKLGIVNLVTASEVSYGTAFVIGAIASVSTCMAVVGGLVLSVSANYAKGGDAIQPQMLFHAGRLVSFLILGGAIGALGAVFTLGATAMSVLSMMVALILILLGINLLDVFPWTKGLVPALPSVLGRHISGFKHINHTLTPVLLGAASFFLPCGFTQSMQLYALTTGNFWTGAMTMFAFALGTLPVLALLSFSSLSLKDKAQSGVFYKTAGLVVVFFGLLNLSSALASAGIIRPLLNF